MNVKDCFIKSSWPTPPYPGMHTVHLGLLQFANASTIHLLNDNGVFSALLATWSLNLKVPDINQYSRDLHYRCDPSLGGETLSAKLAHLTREFNKWCQANKIRPDFLKRFCVLLWHASFAQQWCQANKIRTDFLKRLCVLLWHASFAQQWCQVNKIRTDFLKRLCVLPWHAASALKIVQKQQCWKPLSWYMPLGVPCQGITNTRYVLHWSQSNLTTSLNYGSKHMLDEYWWHSYNKKWPSWSMKKKIPQRSCSWCMGHSVLSASGFIWSNQLSDIFRMIKQTTFGTHHWCA